MAGPASAEDLFPSDAGPWADPHGTIASILGPGQISSAVRSLATNTRVGGSPTSSHLTAQAVDWIPADGDTRTAAQKLAASGVPYDQIIDEGTHVHVGFGPKMRGQALTSVPAPAPDAASLFPPDASTMFPTSPPPVPKLLPKAVPVPPSLMDKVNHAVEATSSYVADNPVSNYVGQEINSSIVKPVTDAAHTIAESYRHPVPAQVNPLPKLQSDLKVAGSIINIPMSLLNAVPHATLERPYGAAVSAATGGKYSAAQGEADMTTALMGLGAGEGIHGAPVEGGAPAAGPGETTAPAAPRGPPAAEDLFPAASEPIAPQAAPETPMQEVGASKNRGVTIEAPEAPEPPAAEDLFPTEPPVPEGMTRMYHGGNPDADPNQSLWFTSHRPNAEGYAAGRASDGTGPKAGLWYVDIPESMRWSGEPGEGPEDGFAPKINMELPPEISAQRKLLVPSEDNIVPFPKSRTLAAAAESDDPELVGSAHVGDGGPVVGDEADPVERVDNALYRLSGHKEADKVDVQQFLKAMPDEIKDPAVQEELYHAIEQKMVDPNATIPEHLQPAFEAMAGPYKEQTDLINHLRDLGDPEAEHYGYDTGYVARRAEGHTPLFDDTEGPSRGDPILGTKPTLTARAQAQKQRTAGFMATDQDGNTVFTDTPDRTDIMDRPYASVRPATTAEIEANTGTTYHKNALVNTLDNVMHLRQVVRNHEVLDELKQNLIDQGLAHRDEHYFRGEDGMMNTVQANSERPEGFRQVPSVPQLKGMSFAPHIAEVLEDNFNRSLPGDPLEALSKVNRALTVPMFITPAIHAQNVAVHWGIGRGFDWVRPGGMKSLLNDGASAIHQVLTMGPIYKDLIRDGMAGQFIGTQTRDFHAKLLKAAGREMDPEMQSIFAKAAGVPWKAIKAAYDTSSKALWYVNDVMLMQRVLELKRKGMSTHAAIYEAEREIPNYRIPPRVGGTKAGVAGRTASRVLQSSAIGMFNRYKYGAARAWAALAKDLAKGDASQRAEAVGKLLVAIVTATAMYPAMDWAAQKVTGNKNARFKRAGGLAMTDAAYDMATGQKDPSLASSTFFSPGPVEQLGTGLVGNHDFFGRDIRTSGAPPWYQSAEAAKYLGTQGFYPGRLADQTVAGHGDQALGALAGLQLPTDKQMQNKTKFAAKDKAAGARVVGRTSNLVRQGKVGQAIDELGKDPH